MERRTPSTPFFVRESSAAFGDQFAQGAFDDIETFGNDGFRRGERWQEADDVAIDTTGQQNQSLVSGPVEPVSWSIRERAHG